MALSMGGLALSLDFVDMKQSTKLANYRSIRVAIILFFWLNDKSIFGSVYAPIETKSLLR